ncbi:hypothetical protein [Flavobacterium columnare]|uniref:Uncharacterized protein n=1 Tax=Flavobacterium columnare TaxID=996 RepID=A0AAI8GA72_9FLAO|nr:hypothetical protein [Flavobacterium columnare]AMO19223.1 hypothetical protein UN65_01605 [Flavobacterium columnare]AUX17156.1 hypothetical protein AQ623_01660 [Flavobacterium columnare]QOG56174.1 hypothetical protein HUE29_01620 [Flavobacterium columnare]QOG58897.1 hypothetical protein HUE30_01620 [Flavobacterium columnare]QOG61619.1 hypothetical protein HUE31_01625 [Flavobacterium columnare]
MSKDKFNQTADSLFASTAHQELWVNPKGEFFTSENIGSLSLEPGQKLQKFERPEDTPSEEKKVKPIDQKETIANLLKVDTLEGLKPYETDERKAVKAVYNNMLKKLIDNTTVVGATDVTGAKK